MPGEKGITAANGTVGRQPRNGRDAPLPRLQALQSLRRSLGQWNVVERVDRGGWWEVVDRQIAALGQLNKERTGVQFGEHRHVAEARAVVAVMRFVERSLTVVLRVVDVEGSLDRNRLIAVIVTARHRALAQAEEHDKNASNDMECAGEHR